MGSCHPMASIPLVCKGSSALVFKLNSRLEKFNCLLITTWVFNRLAKFSISKTVLSSLLPFKINKHKTCFLSSPSFTFLRIWHSIYSTAPEKNLRRRYLSSLFSHIWHPTYQVFFRSAFDQWFRVYHPFQSHSWIPPWIPSRSLCSHSCPSTQYFHSITKVIIWKYKSDDRNVLFKISKWFSILLRKYIYIFFTRRYQPNVIGWCWDHRVIQI